MQDTELPAANQAGADLPVYQAHGIGAAYPMAIYNGYLTSAPNRQAPSTDIDHSPREFRRFVNASGAQDMQLNNGLQKAAAMGRRIPWVSYLYAAQPRIPGQMRDDYGGQVTQLNTGPGPLEYQGIFQSGPGAQPQAPGGSRQIAGDFIYNPGTS